MWGESGIPHYSLLYTHNIKTHHLRLLVPRTQRHGSLLPYTLSSYSLNVMAVIPPDLASKRRHLNNPRRESGDGVGVSLGMGWG